MKTSRRASLVAAALVAVCSPATAYTIYVPDGQPTIQAGIDAASAGDTVLVACGTYYEHDIVMKSGVCLTSETGFSECATIDAQSLGRGIDCTGVDSAARVVGFTVTGGHVEDYPAGVGGGILCESDSDPEAVNCVFSGNYAKSGGGGAYCGTGSSPGFTSCVFSGNCDLDSYSDGGVYCHGTGSSPTLVSCVFSSNAADCGGGLFCSESTSPAVIDCTFEDNSAYWGGGIYCEFYSSPVTEGCTFIENWSWFPRGGGMACYTSSLSLTDCTFYANAGSGFYVAGDGTVLELAKTIIAFGTSGAGVHCDWPTAVATLACCDIYGNAGGDWVGCIAEQYGMDDNISEDPLFCDATNGDFTIDAASPCALANNPACGLVGAWDVSCDTPVEAVSWGMIKAMFQ